MELSKIIVNEVTKTRRTNTTCSLPSAVLSAKSSDVRT